nr:protein FAM107B isoform X7 [Gorilla gorilla gorilla]XP_055209740.1 protein FAM107B isoform X7 [Gorilla gorilla gorilla]XP_055209741.1 protein FAM107B isoform X7 [Gorilla gorilla gorilla]XP_055209742.1 protein FAM107B isoform X7 [Gorilla gorilla gorilla]
MAEPDYIEDDNPELIRPQKLINPVKTSRNHQDLHRELLMNQKRGLAPQNKPELQKVMEKRKRDQVIKQKEEEAQKKKSDLEIELLKRQQKLEQVRGIGWKLSFFVFVLKNVGVLERAGFTRRASVHIYAMKEILETNVSKWGQIRSRQGQESY